MLHSISPHYCHERAIQARSLAKCTTEPEAREAILAVAEQYEHLAQRGELLRRKHGVDTHAVILAFPRLTRTG